MLLVKAGGGDGDGPSGSLHIIHYHRPVAPARCYHVSVLHRACIDSEYFENLSFAGVCDVEENL